MKRQGFTLIELLVVIGIIAILAAIVLVAVNPARQFAISRDTARRNDIYQTLNAIHQYAVDNNGQFPTQINTTFTDIGTGGLNLAADLVPTYIPAVPIDPKSGDDSLTGYVIAINLDNRLTATATGAEATVPLTITR